MNPIARIVESNNWKKVAVFSYAKGAEVRCNNIVLETKIKKEKMDKDTEIAISSLCCDKLSSSQQAEIILMTADELDKIN